MGVPPNEYSGPADLGINKSESNGFLGHREAAKHFLTPVAGGPKSQ